MESPSEREYFSSLILTIFLHLNVRFITAVRRVQMLKTSMCGNNFFYWYCGCIAANFCLDFPCEYLKILIFKCCFFHRTQSVYIFETKFLFFRNNFTFTGSMLVGCFFSCNCTYWAARPSELKVQQQSKKVHWGAKEFSFDKIFFSSGRIKIFRGISI